MMLDDKTIFWLGRRKRDIKNKFGYFCRHCGQYKHQFVEWCNDEYYCPICTRKYDYMDAAEFEARVAEKLATVICAGCEDFNKKNVCPLTIYQARGICECRMKHARLAVERAMIAEGKGQGRPEDK